jgi:hypothetical protein
VAQRDAKFVEAIALNSGGLPHLLLRNIKDLTHFWGSRCTGQGVRWLKRGAYHRCTKQPHPRKGSKDSLPRDDQDVGSAAGSARTRLKNRRPRARVSSPGSAALSRGVPGTLPASSPAGGQTLRGQPLVSQGDSPFAGAYPQINLHCRWSLYPQPGPTRRPAGNMMMPDRCQTPEVPILQTSKCPLPPTPQRLRSRHIPASGRSNVARMWQTQA